MSSPKAAAKAVRRPPANARSKAAAAKPAGKPVAARAVTAKAAPAKPQVVVDNELSADAIRLAREIEKAFTKSETALSVDAMQTLMGTLCRIYSVQVENGANYTPIEEGQAVNPTGVMITASGLLRAANLAVFELGMWQSWTGR
jgi:hypothetical protein